MASRALRCTAVALTLSLALSHVSTARAQSTDLQQWSRIGRVPIGDTIQVASDDHTGAIGPFVSISDDAITVLVAPQGTSERSLNRLTTVLRDHPEAFVESTMNERAYPSEHVRIAPEGVFVDATRLGALAELRRTFPRERVNSVDHFRPASHASATKGVLVGVGLGLFLAGRAVWTGLSETRCQPSCPSAGGGLALGAVVALAGGMIGAAHDAPEWQPVYRRP